MTDGADEDPLVPGDTIDAKYRVLRPLGTGRMGTVVSARHIAIGQVVALKVLSAEMAANVEEVTRFLREGKAASLLQSEHTARIYEVGRMPNGRPFMAMEYLEGEDLAALASRRKLSTEEVTDYVLQAIVAISEAHRNGLVHRNLRPHNLFLARRQHGPATIKVLDFGMSSADPFISPEQLQAPPEQMDPRTDIWALGATLRALTDNEALEKIFLRCLEKDPDQRFATVDDLATALRRVAARASSAKMLVSEDSATLPLSAAAAAGAMPVSEDGATFPVSSGMRASALVAGVEIVVRDPPAPAPAPAPAPPSPSTRASAQSADEATVVARREREPRGSGSSATVIAVAAALAIAIAVVALLLVRALR